MPHFSTFNMCTLQLDIAQIKMHIFKDALNIKINFKIYKIYKLGRFINWAVAVTIKICSLQYRIVITYPKEILSLSPEKYETSVIHLHRDKKFKWQQENLSWMHARIVRMVEPRSRLGQPFCLTNDRDLCLR